MSGRRDSLAPPDKKDVQDPGAHDLESSSDEHFSDAQSAQSQEHSPIPKLRVEKLSDEPSHGEVPGTEAYRMREGDAEPDEIAIIPEKKSAGESGSEEEGQKSGASTPGGKPVPKTVVEQTEDASDAQAHPEKKHRADPPPDLVVKAGADDASESPISPAMKTPRSARSRRKPSFPAPDDEDNDDADAEADDFGDDFDDFEEGAEDGEDDDEFGDFDDGFDAPAAAPTPAPPAPPPIQPLSFPIPDFEDLDSEDILSLTEPYLNALYPPDDTLPTFPPLSKENAIFLTPRSASLWSQLAAPPPLQPPDWIRSRIRRLFLVSLGVPLNLDEVLPASKQKKLILPSLAVPPGASPRTSTDSRPNAARRAVGGGDNASSTSVDTQGKPKRSRSSKPAKKGPPPAPELDLSAAKQLCTTTDEALDGMTDAELREHVRRLREYDGVAGGVLEYWKKRADEKIGDREAFEGVIENLVKHARKVRK